MIDQQRIHPGFTKHQLLFWLSKVLNPQDATLIVIQLVDHPIIQMETHQAADIASGEPRLVF
ncbi:hypothetical protein OC71_07430 [Pseudomonas sp. W15Feb9B]|nr:hypothetical protein OC71_07430 [Pseudomonas sp. W15Feb9B]